MSVSVGACTMVVKRSMHNDVARNLGLLNQVGCLQSHCKGCGSCATSTTIARTTRTTSTTRTTKTTSTTSTSTANITRTVSTFRTITTRFIFTLAAEKFVYRKFATG